MMRCFLRVMSCFRGSDAEPQAQVLAEAPATSQSGDAGAGEAPARGSAHIEPCCPSGCTLIRESKTNHSDTMPSKLRIQFCDLSFYELIGKGSFKAVYRGRWNNTNVAIVSMRRGGVVKEARIQQLIGNHPNIVQFYRWTTDALANEFMVMEYVKLGSMDKVLLSHGKSLQMRQRLAMCEQICSGMYELAYANVLHRDLAGRNILVSSLEPVHVKVSDFGLAWIQPDDPTAPPDKPPSIPIRWSPPEVLTRCEWTEKSDVWSFGVTMWEIFSSGSEPYAHFTDEQVFESVINFKVLSRPKRCPKEVYGLMLRCWDKDPAQRPTFADILQVFRGWRDLYHKKAVVKFSGPHPSHARSGKATTRQSPQPLPGPQLHPQFRTAASVPDLSRLQLPSVAGPAEPFVIPSGHESTSAMIDDVLSQHSHALAQRSSIRMDSTHKMDLIHILSSVSLSHDGSNSGLVAERNSGNTGRDIGEDIGEESGESSLVVELPMPPTPAPKDAPGKDMSLDYLVCLRAPACTEIAEPVPEPSSSGEHAFSGGNSLSGEMLGMHMLRKLTGTPERRSPGARPSSQACKQLRKLSMPVPLHSPTSLAFYSRAPSIASLLNSEAFSESHMSFEFELPIDPVMSPTTTLSARFDSINFSDLGCDSVEHLATPFPSPLVSNAEIFKSHELSPALGMIGSREQSFDYPRSFDFPRAVGPRGQRGQRRSSRLAEASSQQQPCDLTCQHAMAEAAGAGCSAKPSNSGGAAAQLPHASHSWNRNAVPSMSPGSSMQQPPARSSAGEGREGVPRACRALSPYVDLQFLVRAQDQTLFG